MIPLLIIGAGAYLIYDSQKPKKMAKGGSIQVGDSALVNSKNKMGVIIKINGNKYHLRFVDGTDGIYEASDLRFMIDDEMAKGGAVKRFVEMRKGKPVYALKDAIYHMSGGFLNDKGYPETTGTQKVYRLKSGLQKIEDYRKDPDYSVLNETEDESGISMIQFVDKTGFVIEFSRDDLYENGGIIENPVFTFKTDNEYHNARRSGYIDDYDIVRIEIKHPLGSRLDFATHSEEEYLEALDRIKKSEAQIIRTYQDKMYYDINEYYDADEDKGGDEEYNTGGEIDTARNYVMFVDTLQDADRLGFGGKVKFKDKVKSISENLKGRKVPKKLQKEYGKTYDKKWERDESARRIAGSQLKRMNIK